MWERSERHKRDPVRFRATETIKTGVGVVDGGVMPGTGAQGSAVSVRTATTAEPYTESGVNPRVRGRSGVL